MDFYPTRSERRLTIEVHDATGLDVPAFLDMGGEVEDWIPFCGSIEKPRPVAGEFRVLVYAYRSPNLPPCPGSATTGTVEVTFFR